MQGDQSKKPLLTKKTVVKITRPAAEAKKPDSPETVTTKVVRSVLENVYPGQSELAGTSRKKKEFCGVCEKCQIPDCGYCSTCKHKMKFGTTSKLRSKPYCKNRRCSAIDSDEDEVDVETVEPRPANQVPVEWIGDSTSTIEGHAVYNEAKFGQMTIKPGDYVMINTQVEGEPIFVAKIQYIYPNRSNTPIFHGRLLYRGTNTILGETAEPRELFITDLCGDYCFDKIVKKVTVSHRRTAKNWVASGKKKQLKETKEEEGKTYFFNKRYERDFARFTDYIKELTIDVVDPCPCCQNKKKNRQFNTPTINKNIIEWRGEKFRVGTSVFLVPQVYKFKSPKPPRQILKDLDEDIYTEYHRKRISPETDDTPEPFRIGVIEEIIASDPQRSEDIKLKVRLFYRPENTRDGIYLKYYKDINAVYWSDKVIFTTFDNVCAKMYLRYFDPDKSPEEWIKKGPYRFYFNEAYDAASFNFIEVPKKATLVGNVRRPREAVPEWPKINAPLKCLDIFAGCGAFSEGLQQAGLCETKWAVEKDENAAITFKVNSEDCNILTGDCAMVLKKVLGGKAESLGFPKKGGVDIIIGGSPYQGYSSINKFTKGNTPVFCNSLVISCLSYCEYYRPKYFILENVKHIIPSQFNVLLRFILKSLLMMNYQVTIAAIQAGQYGVPQTRKRFMVIAAASGYVLPRFPDPITVFDIKDCLLTFKIDGHTYTNDFRWAISAPYRNVDVRDAIGDLPAQIRNNSARSAAYEYPPESTFQKMMRKMNLTEAEDHVSKRLQLIDLVRISFIPREPGADWRDLPNISGQLSNGKQYSKLYYPNSGEEPNPDDPPQGTCHCATGGKCCANKAVLTLIPWCLHHTADQNDQWAGAYGRLHWNGYFAPTLANPNPLNKQGRVIHPEANRVISVREAARSQGFPDHYKFCGTMNDKYQQIGNAIPPPLAAAIGLEIKRAFMNSYQIV